MTPQILTFISLAILLIFVNYLRKKIRRLKNNIEVLHGTVRHYEMQNRCLRDRMHGTGSTPSNILDAKVIK